MLIAEDRLPPMLLTVFAAFVVAGQALWGWIPILDGANLLFHEAGHPIFGLLSDRLAVYGGTLMQLLIPAACAWEFARRRHIRSYHFCLIWLAENLLNISHYVADARAHRLPLVAGVDPELFHDWTEILGRWGLLSQNLTVAFLIRLLAILLIGWTLVRTWAVVREHY